MQTFQRVSGVFLVGILAVITVSPCRAAGMGGGDSKSGVGGVAGAVGELRRSAADLLRAQATCADTGAQVDKTGAETRKIHLECDSMALDNDVKSTAIFYEKRRMREQYLAEHARKRPSRESVVRRCNATKPQRPGSYQVDPVSGSIYWPEALRGEEFQEYRTQIEALFASRSLENGGPGSDLCRQVQELAGQMCSALKSRIRQIGSGEYMAAKRFVEGLAYEARFLPEIEGIAAG